MNDRLLLEDPAGDPRLLETPLPVSDIRKLLRVGVAGGDGFEAFSGANNISNAERKPLAGIPSGGEGKFESEATSPILRVLSAKPEAAVPILIARACRLVGSSGCNMIILGSDTSF